ncbi:MAG: allophanate hydrolase subunit 1 [Cryobacterium sp.]|nr:allophanate hydrolase subunit 1 [Cryobacterium sp.]
MKLLPYGEKAILVEFEDLDSTVSAFIGMERNKPAGVIELVPAARTILVRVDLAKIGLRAAAEWISQVESEPSSSEPRSYETKSPEPLLVRVRYDGQDLASVAKLLGMSVESLIKWHTSTPWICVFTGFAPGFGYLAGGNKNVPRLETSRQSVPTGAVGLAGEFCGIYPRSSPGGWQLIGSTGLELWNLDRVPPALITPGVSVRFEAVSK